MTMLHHTVNIPSVTNGKLMLYIFYHNETLINFFFKKSNLTLTMGSKSQGSNFKAFDLGRAFHQLFSNLAAH